MNSRPPLYLFGTPGEVGGAATKIAHLIRLLGQDFAITVIPPAAGKTKDKRLRKYLEPNGIKCRTLKELPKRLEGVGLAICEKDFFADGRAHEVKNRGLKLVWSNEMMFPFKGEEKAAEEGLIDRVLYVSEHQARAFDAIYQSVPSFLTGNFIDADDYSWRERRNSVFTIGRLSRPDPRKYPVNFPVFYEELGLSEARYRVMAWNPEVQREYRWHSFGPEWELLPPNKETALRFLYSLDLFVYPLGHRIKESWGRAVVESMLTGAVAVVPTGHRFDKLLVHGESGFLCHSFQDWKTVVRELYENYPLRKRISRRASEFARETLCNPEEHRRRWVEALTI